MYTHYTTNPISHLIGFFYLKVHQLFLNDLYYFNSVELLQYAMVKTYLEDIDFLLTTDKQIRFNKRQNRMYLDIDWNYQSKDTFIIIDCYRILDPNDFTKVYNDSFLKSSPLGFWNILNSNSGTTAII